MNAPPSLAVDVDPDLPDQVLDAHEYDARAAVSSLLHEIADLHARLLVADTCISKGYSRGWSAIASEERQEAG